MSREAMSAVLHHSQLNRPETLLAYNILMTIAEFASVDGVTGVAGERRKCLSIGRIAKSVGCHRNSVMPLVERIAEAGELSYEAYGKSGRGRYYVFHILLPIEHIQYGSQSTQKCTQPVKANVQNVQLQPPNCTMPLEDTVQIGQLDVENGTNGTTALESDVQLLKETVEDLNAQMAHLIAQIAQLNAQMAQSPSRSTVHDTNSKKPNKETNTPSKSPPWLAQTKAILKVCDLNGQIQAHVSNAEQAAQQLSQFPVEQILARYGRQPPANYSGWNWFKHDFRGQKGQPPTPKQVVQTISQKVPMPVVQNGYQYQAPPASAYKV